MIMLTANQFYSNRTWLTPIDEPIVPLSNPDWIDMFDQNGYRLTKLESHYAGANNHPTVNHRHEVCLRQDWFTSEKKTTGPHLNHAFLFERKGYSGDALVQLKEFAQQNNLINKLVNYRGKWGIDFSMDYVDSLGNSMEILHFEYDSYSQDEIREMKERVGNRLAMIDWEYAAKTVLERKDEWIDLEFFDQSKWKTDFFDLPAERFKCNAWE
jgi:hypothetical protein